MGVFGDIDVRGKNTLRVFLFIYEYPRERESCRC